MGLIHLSPATAGRWRCFRRRTWLVVGACMALRAAAALAGIGSPDDDNAFAAQPSVLHCPLHKDIAPC